MRNNSTSSYQNFSKKFNAIELLFKDHSLPNLFIYGSSQFLMFKLWSRLTTLSREIKAETTSFEAKSLSGFQLADILRSRSIFNDREMYFVSEVEKKGDFSTSLQNIESIPSDTGLVLRSFKSTVDAKMKKQLERLKIESLGCFELKPFEVSLFVRDVLRERGLRLSKDAVNLIVEAFVGDICAIDNELAKISLIYPNSNQVLTRDEIGRHLGLIKEDVAFKLAGLILDGRRASALSLLHALLHKGESSLALTGLIARFARNLLLISHSLSLTDERQKQMLTTVKLPPFIVSKYKSFILKNGIEPARRSLLMCAKADRLFKTVAVSHELILTEALLPLL